MKIGYFGDGAWARQALDLVLSDDELSVSFVVPRHDTPDAQLCAQAEQHGVEVLRLADVNADESLKLIDSYGVDVIVSMSFNQIMKGGLLGLCPKGTINCHAGALPFYRGRNVLNWVLINDESEFGVTVHYMDEGIDTGDIILQHMSPITDDDTYATLLERATSMCATMLHDALKLLGRDEAPRIEQSTIHPVGFYCGRRVNGDEWIDWTWSSRRIFNFIRAITTPGPCARTALGGTEVKIAQAEMIPDAPAYIATAGEIVGQSARGTTVKTGDSTIRLTDVDAGDESLHVGKRFVTKG